MEDLRIDAELWDHLEVSRVPFPAQDIGGILVPGNPGGGDEVVQPLEETEWRRVAPKEILPRDEDHLSAEHPADQGGVEGDDVVGLFFDVEDVRAEAPRVCPQSGIEVQMVMAVEDHRLGDQLVPCGV